MKKNLIILADQKMRNNDRNGVIKAIEALYALFDAETEAATILKLAHTNSVSLETMSSVSQTERHDV